MKLNDYQISGSMSGTGVVLWNLGIKENKKSIKMGRNEKKKNLRCEMASFRTEDHYTHVAKLMFCIWVFITRRKKKEKNK